MRVCTAQNKQMLRRTEEPWCYWNQDIPLKIKIAGMKLMPFMLLLSSQVTLVVIV